MRFVRAMITIVVLAVLPLAMSVTGTARQPNVLVILADDQGWGDLSLHGNPNLSTPNIDSLARDGAQVKHFYVCAVCSPTRAEFLTGRYHTRMGVMSTSQGGERFHADEQTIAQVFANAGYATAAFGKWHSGMQYPYHPNARGFDEYYGFCSGHWGHYYSPMLEHNGAIVRGRGFIVDDLTDHAIEFMNQNREKPFLIYLPLNTPHSPMQVPDEYWAKFADKELVPDPAPENAKKQNLVHTRAALAMCENIDANVGRLLKHLAKVGLENETIVVYFSDNGPNGSRFNGGMRGRKGSTFEGGLRSPCLIRYPQKIPAGTEVREISAAIDLLPTLADLAEVGLDSPRPLDGSSIADWLCGDASDPSDRILFSAWKGKASVRTQHYRMQRNGQLFDLRRDPGEKTNVAEAHPDVARRLSADLDRWLKETHSESADNWPLTLGHPRATWTQLPARDATSLGGIKRSNRFPNCTFFGNWTKTSDAIDWDVDIPSEGRFEVQMYYACDSTSVGTELELTLGEARLQATIHEPNPSPEIGAAEDRFERAEGYVRDWRPMTLGTLEVEPGRKRLRLRATKITGKEVCEMRLLMFRRL